MNKEFKNYLAVSWDKVLSDEKEIINLLNKLNIPCMTDVVTVSREYTDDNRLIMLIEAGNVNAKTFRIIIDATSGIPTWQQFISVTYDQGESANIKIILYGEDYNDKTIDFTAGGLIEIGNLVRRNNKCCVTTYLAKGISYNQSGQKMITSCDVMEAPGDVSDELSINGTQTLPTKRQVQEAEFWTGYYFPQWATDPIGMDDDIINDWAPGYSLGKDLNTEASWNDDGFFIKLIGEPGSEAIQWIWDNRKGAFESQYPDCPVTLENNDGKPYAISVRILDIPMTSLINMTSKDKWYYGDTVFGEEHNFQEVACSVSNDYDEMVKAVKAA